MGSWLIDFTLPILGVIFLGSLFLGYREWQRFKLIDELNRSFYGQSYIEDRQQ